MELAQEDLPLARMGHQVTLQARRRGLISENDGAELNTALDRMSENAR